LGLSVRREALIIVLGIITVRFDLDRVKFVLLSRLDSECKVHLLVASLIIERHEGRIADEGDFVLGVLDLLAVHALKALLKSAPLCALVLPW